MPKSRNKKDHKKRVSARNQKINDQKKHFQKAQHDMLMRMIEQEKNKGMFDNLPNIDSIDGEISVDGPLI